jgi:hypothetical protein
MPLRMELLSDLRFAPAISPYGREEIEDKSPRYPRKNPSKPARLLQIQEINPWVPKPCYVDLTETMKGLLQRL